MQIHKSGAPGGVHAQSGNADGRGKAKSSGAFLLAVRDPPALASFRRTSFVERSFEASPPACCECNEIYVDLDGDEIVVSKPRSVFPRGARADHSFNPDGLECRTKLPTAR